jgi:sulfite exporter TauE/SafE
MSITLIVTAFFMGLLGSTHCVVMCGGIVSTLSSGLTRQAPLVQLHREKPRSKSALTLAYNGGRLGSYAAAGAVAGAFGTLASRIEILSGVSIGLRLFAGIFMVALGLYLAGAWKKFAIIERIGAPVWSRIQPLAKKLLPVRTLRAALGLGALWGFMPCGLVYAALGVALGTGSADTGALAMTAFFFGTLPSLLAVSAFATFVSGIVKRPWVRRAAGITIIAFGVVNVRTAAAFASADTSPISKEHACCAHGPHGTPAIAGGQPPQAHP